MGATTTTTNLELPMHLPRALPHNNLKQHLIMKLDRRNKRQPGSNSLLEFDLSTITKAHPRTEIGNKIDLLCQH